MRRSRAAIALLVLGGVVAGTAGAAAPPAVKPVTVVGKTHLDTVVSPLVLQDKGTVKGSPIGSADVVLRYTLKPAAGMTSVTYTMTNASGTVTGTALARYSTNNLVITFTGRAAFTSGTGAYAGIKAPTLQFNAKHSITGKREAIAFTGRATIPRS